MSFLAKRQTLEKGLSISLARRERKWPSLQRVRLKPAEFERAVSSWLSAEVEALPCLQGICVEDRAVGGGLISFFFETDPAYLVCCAEVEFEGPESIPDISRIWPYATWWQEEMAAFRGIGSQAKPNEKAGIVWRLA